MYQHCVTQLAVCELTTQTIVQDKPDLLHGGLHCLPSQQPLSSAGVHDVGILQDNLQHGRGKLHCWRHHMHHPCPQPTGNGRQLEIYPSVAEIVTKHTGLFL